MVTRGVCVALFPDFEVYGWAESTAPAIDDLKKYDLLILEADPSDEGARQSANTLRKEGRPPILWIASEGDRKPSGHCLFKPFDQAALVGAVCELLKISVKALEERRSPIPPDAASEPDTTEAQETT